MMELSKLSRYPFLKESKDYIKNNSLSIDELLDDPLYERARLAGIERLDNAFKDKDVGNRSLSTETDYIMELLSYPIARMITVCIGDIYFKRRYALGEAVHSYRNLINEPTSFLINISNEFNLNIKYNEDLDILRIYFTDYLHYTPTRYKQWKMINREMDKGYIRINHKDLARLIQEALRCRINNELDFKKCNENVFNTFFEDIKRIQNTVLKHRKKIQSTPFFKLDTKKLPPCMDEILSSIQSGENVPHMGRFAIVAFLNSLKLETDDILKLFSGAPDYEEEKTRYQVDHITGHVSKRSYSPPGCDKMRTYGICPTEKMDDLCRKSRHPLGYYKARWRNKSANEGKENQ
jgi:DNA primase large subunit